MKKLKKIGIIICTAILTIYSKVFASDMMLDPSMYQGQPAYGVYVPTAGERILYILKIAAIPIILLIGIIIYLIKSKSSKKKTIIVVGSFLALTGAIYAIIFELEYLMNQVY